MQADNRWFTVTVKSFRQLDISIKSQVAQSCYVALVEARDCSTSFESSFYILLVNDGQSV